MVAVVHSLTSSETEAEEWRLRCDMAAVFRVCARLGWNEQIGNHNSLMLPQRSRDDAPLFLINPRGRLFQELTASSLIVCDLDGRVLRGTGELRKVAFHIHARIHLHKPGRHLHRARASAVPDRAVDAGSAGVRAGASQQPAAERPRGVRQRRNRAGATTTPRATASPTLMGDKTIMVMGAHGVTVVGPTVHDAFDECYIAERTCMYQMTAMMTGQKLRALPDASRRRWTGPWGDKIDAPPASGRLAPYPGSRGTRLRELTRRQAAGSFFRHARGGTHPGGWHRIIRRSRPAGGSNPAPCPAPVRATARA